MAYHFVRLLRHVVRESVGSVRLVRGLIDGDTDGCGERGQRNVQPLKHADMQHLTKPVLGKVEGETLCLYVCTNAGSQQRRIRIMRVIGQS